jgi:hypothetical protein
MPKVSVTYPAGDKAAEKEKAKQEKTAIPEQ